MTNHKNMNIITKRRLFLLLTDVCIVMLSCYFSLYLRFDGSIEQNFIIHLKNIIIPCIICNIGVFYLCHLYQSLWEFASITELFNIIAATLFSTILFCIMSYASGNYMPRSSYFIFFLLLTSFTGISRFTYRFVRSFRALNTNSDSVSNVLIIGAGDAGERLIDEIHRSSKVDKNVCCIIDDDRVKWNRILHDVPIVGGRYDIQKAVEKYNINEIFLAIPTITEKEAAAILNICSKTSCSLKRLPGMFQFVNGDVSISKLKKVEIQDLLGREPVTVNLNDIMGYVHDQVILVTGGGGSIGSELCRQIAANKPKQLIIVDIYENNAYDIQIELQKKYPKLNLITLIASVRDEQKVLDIFKNYRPDIVYHAAAHKHVPLMETSPCEAVKNNVFGTLNIVKAANEYKAKKFIMISTDKAVNPTNVMGTTKRICEMIIQIYDAQSKTDYVAVRFGNVLGSNGSVIPLFKKQIAQGGPITVTHPDIIRYFMTIPEAVSLVLQAGAYAKGGEIFILDMGDPVRIDDMARNLVRLSGYIPDVDISIVYTGLRPGEKLFEEILLNEEGLHTTPNQLIYVGNPISINTDLFTINLLKLREAALSDDKISVLLLLKSIVPEFHHTDNKVENKKTDYVKESAYV